MLTGLNAGVANQDALTRMHLSESHHGCSPAVWPGLAAEAERLRFYPEPDCRRIRERIAEHHGVTLEEVVVGNGTDELILMASLAFLDGGLGAVGSSATFPGYLMSAALARTPLREVPLDGYRIPLEGIAAACEEAPAVAFLCNPHNPAGTAAGASELERFFGRVQAQGTLVLVDEAYAEFAGEAFASTLPLVQAGHRAIVLRTFSKAYGLAGLRIGYAIGPSGDIARMLRVKASQPFSVNRLAQAAAAIALEDQAFLRHVVSETRRAKQMFCEGMDRIGVPWIPSETNFVLIRVPDSKDVCGRLHRDHGVLCRDAGLFGLSGHVRVSMGRVEQMAPVLAAITEILRAPAPAGATG